MRDLKNKRRSRYGATPLWGLCAVALLIAATGPAVAQTTDSDAPIRLVPLEEIVAPDEISPPPEAIDAPLLLDVENLAAPMQTPEGDSARLKSARWGKLMPMMWGC